MVQGPLGDHAWLVEIWDLSDGEASLLCCAVAFSTFLSECLDEGFRIQMVSYKLAFSYCFFAHGSFQHFYESYMTVFRPVLHVYLAGGFGSGDGDGFKVILLSLGAQVMQSLRYEDVS